MSFGILVGTVVTTIAVVVAVLIGFAYLFARRGKSVPPLPWYAGGMAVLLVAAALVKGPETEHLLALAGL